MSWVRCHQGWLRRLWSAQYSSILSCQHRWEEFSQSDDTWAGDWDWRIFLEYSLTVHDLPLGRPQLNIHQALLDREARRKEIDLHHQALRKEPRKFNPSRTPSWSDYSYQMSLWCFLPPKYRCSKNIHRNWNWARTYLQYDKHLLLTESDKEWGGGCYTYTIETLLQCINTLRSLLCWEASRNSWSGSPYPHHSWIYRRIRTGKGRYRYYWCPPWGRVVLLWEWEDDCWMKGETRKERIHQNIQWGLLDTSWNW